MILKQIFKERNSSKSTQITYTRSCKYYENHTGYTIKECLDIADDEEYKNIRWKNTQTRKWLLSYREWLYNKYNVSTAQLYLTAILTIYRHFEITIPPLPYYSTAHLKKSTPINYNDLPNRELLQNLLKACSPLSRALILFMSSSGISRIDVLNLTIDDYLNATSEYHDHQDSVKYAIRDMREKNIIPTFKLKRQKTGVEYFTFCSHEAVKSINAYLLTRTEILHRNLPLFKLHERYLNMIFERLNSQFHLEKINNRNRITPHMLRKYHASQLAEAGMNTTYINLLQGRQITDVAHKHYIKYNPETVKEAYIGALPFLVIEETERYKSELEQTSEELETVKGVNDELKSSISRIFERLNDVEERARVWDELKRKQK